MKGRMLGIVIGVVFALTGGLGTLGTFEMGALAADYKIGVVDIQRAINDCIAGKEAKRVITQNIEKLQAQMTEKQKELQIMKDSLEKQAPMLSPDARANKEKDLQNRGRDFQRWVEDSQNEINQRRMEIERNISTSLLKVIQRVAAEEGYTLVFEKNDQIVLFASKTIEFTDRVIKAFDAQQPPPKK
jgi:outer membrane protein